MNAQTMTDLALSAYRGDINAQIQVTRALIDMSMFQETLLSDIKTLEATIHQGHRHERVDPAKYPVDNRRIIHSINSTLDAVSGPKKMNSAGLNPHIQSINPSHSPRTWYGGTEPIKNTSNFCTSKNGALCLDTGISIPEIIRTMKIPGADSNFNLFPAHTKRSSMRKDQGSLQNPIAPIPEVDPWVLSTINLQVSEIADYCLRTRKSTTKLANDTARVARSAGSVHYHAERGIEKVSAIFREMQDLSAAIQHLSSDADVVSRMSKNTYQIAKMATERAGMAKNELACISNASTDADVLISDLIALVDRVGDSTGYLLSLSDRMKKLAAMAPPDPKKPLNYHHPFPSAAQEMGFLAGASRESAEKLTNLIRDIQVKSRQAKTCLETVQNEIKKGDAAFNETSALITQVTGSIKEINQNMEDMMTASVTNGRSVRKLTAQVQNVRYVVLGTVEKASDVAKACKNTSSSMYKVANDIAEVKSYAKSVASCTAQFQE